MGNILDYIDWRGDITMDKSAFNPVDGLVLAQLAYIPFDGIVRKGFKSKMKLSKAAARYDRVYGELPDVERNKLLTNSHAVLMKAGTSDRYRNLEFLTIFKNTTRRSQSSSAR